MNRSLCFPGSRVLFQIVNNDKYMFWKWLTIRKKYYEHVYFHSISTILTGTYKERNEIETKRNRNETKRNQRKRNETKWKRNKTKPTKAKRNQRKQNEIENGRKNNRGLKEIKPIFTITMLDYFQHMSFFHQERTGFVTIEQEYYAFIQRESVLLTWWLLLNVGTIRATSSLLKGEELKLKKQKWSN